MDNNYLKYLIKQAFAVCGLELRRVQRKTLLPPLQKNRQGKILEFLGPSASGKSYMMAHLQPHLSGEWHNSKQLFRAKISEVQGDQRERSEVLQDFYRTLYLKKVSNWKSGDIIQKNFGHQIKALGFHIGSIERNFFLDCRDDLSVINDEGLVSNFWRELLSLNPVDSEGLHTAFRRRFVVYLRPSTEHIFRNIEKRRAENPNGVASYLGWSNAELEVYLDSVFVQMDKLTDKLEGIAPSVIRLHGSEVDDIDACCSRILDVLSNSEASDT